MGSTAMFMVKSAEWAYPFGLEHYVAETNPVGPTCLSVLTFSLERFRTSLIICSLSL